MSPACEEKGGEADKETQSVTVDGAIKLAGEYGRFQILVNAMFCLMTFPSVFHVMLMYFAAGEKGNFLPGKTSWIKF